MQIVILMTGSGDRFVKAGYKDWKPTIKVLGKPIFEYIVKMFTASCEFLFLVREEMKKEQGEIEIYAKAHHIEIEYIKGHKKGPVYTVLQSNSIKSMDPNTPLFICYCDFFMEWDFNDFNQFAQSQKAQGIIPVYKGFHPHLVHPNLYAAIKEKEGNVLEIKEKHTYYEDKTKNLYSPGLYYFKNKHVLLHFSELLFNDSQFAINGEYYMSLVYQKMIEDGLNIKYYDKIPYFAQLGTPQDLQEFVAYMSVSQRRLRVC
jgi:NDP-sugar pyrophosphorylase family protein